MSGGRQFNQIAPALWRSARFLAQDTDARLLHVYFLTCEHQNSAGCYRVPDGYVCSDLGWTIDRYKAARDALVETGLVLFDAGTSEVYIQRWFTHCRPANNKHAQGAARRISEIESNLIREQAEADFDAAEGERHARATEAQSHALTNTRYMQPRAVR